MYVVKYKNLPKFNLRGWFGGLDILSKFDVSTYLLCYFRMPFIHFTEFQMVCKATLTIP